MTNVKNDWHSNAMLVMGLGNWIFNCFNNGTFQISYNSKRVFEKSLFFNFIENHCYDVTNLIQNVRYSMFPFNFYLWKTRWCQDSAKRYCVCKWFKKGKLEVVCGFVGRTFVPLARYRSCDPHRFLVRWSFMYSWDGDGKGKRFIQKPL